MKIIIFNFALRYHCKQRKIIMTVRPCEANWSQLQNSDEFKSLDVYRIINKHLSHFIYDGYLFCLYLIILWHLEIPWHFIFSLWRRIWQAPAQMLTLETLGRHFWDFLLECGSQHLHMNSIWSTFHRSTLNCDEIQSWVILSSFVALSITASAQTSPAFCDVSHRMPDCTLAFGCPTTLIDGTARSRWSHDAAMRRARSKSSNAASSAWWSQQMVGRLEKIQALDKSYQTDGPRADPVESSERRVEWAVAISDLQSSQLHMTSVDQQAMDDLSSWSQCPAFSCCCVWVQPNLL